MIQVVETLNYSIHPFRLEDEQGVKGLVELAFGSSLNGAFWDWKYKLNPLFKPCFVMVAEHNGAIVGCNHWLLKNLKLAKSCEAKAVIGAELAVHPDYRRNGIGKNLLQSLRESEAVRREKPLLIQIFVPSASLAEHFHTPVGGYVRAPIRTAYYVKMLNWKKVEARVRSVNDKIRTGKYLTQLPKSPLRIFFNFSNAPPLYFSLTKTGVSIDEKNKDYTKETDVLISGDLATLQQIKANKHKLWIAFKSLLARKFKIKGSLRKIWALYKNSWILLEIFNTNQYGSEGK